LGVEMRHGLEAILAGCLDCRRDVVLSGELSGSVHDVLVALTIDSLGQWQRPDLEAQVHVSEEELATDEQADEDDRERGLLEVSAQVLGTLTQGRSTWTAANARAEVERVTRSEEQR